MPIKKGTPVSRVETAEPRVKRKKKRRKKHSRTFMAIIFALLIIAVLLASVTLFFTVKEIKVTGDSKYTADEIKSTAGIELESNMFAVNKFSVIDKIKSVLPYIENVTIKRDLPNTVIINVTAAKAGAYIDTTGGYVILSTKAKVLENTVDKPSIMQLVGSGIVQNTVGKTADFSDDMLSELYTGLLTRFETMNIADKVTMLNIGRVSSICFEYEGRVIVNLGASEQLDKKMNYFSFILEKNPTAAHASMNLSNTEKATYSGEISKEKYSAEKAEMMSETGDEENQNLSSAQSSGSGS